LFTGGVLPLNDGGALGLVTDFNCFDSAAGMPHGLERDAHLIVGNPHFVDRSIGDYALTAESAAIGKAAPPLSDGLNHDYQGDSRPDNRACDIGAFQMQLPK
jgi:hypothetical protein